MAVTYTVRWRAYGASEWAPEDQVAGLTSTSYAVEGLEAGTRYEVQVIAVADGGTTSAPVQSGRWTVCAAPAQPTAADVLAETAGLSWPTVTGATEYRVTRTPAGGGAATEVATVAAPESGDPSVAVTGLVEESGYDLTVTAVNADGDVSAASTVRSITTTALATGGTVTAGTGTADGYRLHTFTDTASAATFTLNAVRDVEYLVVGGGGSGTRGTCNVYFGHGGGGGGVSTGTLGAASTGSYTITVGAGGAAAAVSCLANHVGNHGGGSSILRGADALVAATGGRAVVGRGTGATAVGGASGSGAIDGTAYTASAGGDGAPSGGYGAGAGGGAGGAAAALAGGTGRVADITGAAVGYGGGGAGRNLDGFGTAVDGGGRGTAGTPGTGGGGSDAADGSGFTAGGSGVVIVRYVVAPGS